MKARTRSTGTVPPGPLLHFREADWPTGPHPLDPLSGRYRHCDHDPAWVRWTRARAWWARQHAGSRAELEAVLFAADVAYPPEHDNRRIAFELCAVFSGHPEWRRS